MWSASSSTLISTSPRWQWPCSIRSSRRPGQATTTSARSRRAATCGCCETPPKIAVTLRPVAWASGARTAWTWLASSRVGTSTSPRGRHAMVCPSASLAASGMENPSVFPDPVRPRPRMSRPARASGSVATWIGNGCVIPPLASAAASGAGTPREPNVTRGEGVLPVRFRCRAARGFSGSRAVKEYLSDLGWPHVKATTSVGTSSPEARHDRRALMAPPDYLRCPPYSTSCGRLAPQAASTRPCIHRIPG